MRSSFIFCLLAMCYIASANEYYCSDMPGNSCRKFCYNYYGDSELRTTDPGTACQTSGQKPGTCKNGECEKK
uniref:Putative salivary secreted protein n=1 Tax=Ixodes scapularis TaxID=6945 RepID=Q4PN75_IXOSC|nr:putative salivary secreted protein [Ixodes scapularis]